ncbi:hypothetical protein NFJ02_29g68310 [Pycnococcus provasolii]
MPRERPLKAWLAPPQLIGNKLSASLATCAQLQLRAVHPACLASNMRAYVDADFAGEVDRKSISGMLGALEARRVLWKSTKQHLTAKSSTEAEPLLSPTTVHPSCRKACAWRIGIIVLDRRLY